MVLQNVRSNSDESFSTRYERSVGRALGPGWLARLAARVRSGSLDDALIAGADPAGSRQLAARAMMLTSPRFRAAAADGLDRWLQAAHGARSRHRVLPPRAVTLANAPELRELIALLRGAGPLYASGIAAVGRLLSDGTGPAYVGDADALARELREAGAAMHASAPARSALIRR